VGFNNYGTISNSYATGSVTGVSYVGGLVGKSNDTIKCSYATNGNTGSGLLVGGGSGTTTGGMKSSLNNLQSTATWAWNTSTWNNGYTGVTIYLWLNLLNAAPVLIPDMPMDTITANSGSKTYDGTTSALGATQVVTLGGSSLSSSITTVSASPNVGSYTITPSGTTPSAPTSQSSLGGVTFVNGTLTITPATLLASTTASKVYNGTPWLSLTGSDTTFTGLDGQTATLNAPRTETLNSSNVGSSLGGTLSVTGSDLIGSTGFSSSNYILPTTFTGGTITPASTNTSGGTSPTTSGGTSTTLVPPPIDGLSSMETSLPFGSSVSNLNMSSTPPSSASGSGVVASLPETVSSNLDGNLLDVEDLSK